MSQSAGVFVRVYPTGTKHEVLYEVGQLGPVVLSHDEMISVLKAAVDQLESETT